METHQKTIRNNTFRGDVTIPREAMELEKPAKMECGNKEKVDLECSTERGEWKR